MSGRRHFAERWPAAPRPWREGCERPLTIVDADGQLVARLSATRGKFEPEAVNLQLILDAVNTHDQLLAALEELRDNVKDDRPEMWGRVDAAIALAKGGAA